MDIEGEMDVVENDINEIERKNIQFQNQQKIF